MAVFIVTFAVVIGIVVLVFASIGIVTVLSKNGHNAEFAREAQDAEARIADIGRRAQEAIIGEALQRLRDRQSGRSW